MTNYSKLVEQARERETDARERNFTSDADLFRALADAVEQLQAERDAVTELLADETWWVGGAWGDYGEPVVLARNVAERLGADYERERDDRTSDYAANYAEAVSAAELAEQERDAARAEVVRLIDGIRNATTCRTPLATGRTNQPTQYVGPCGQCCYCFARKQLGSLLDVAGDDSNKFQCTCGRKFDTLRGLHVHQGHQHHYNKEEDDG